MLKQNIFFYFLLFIQLSSTAQNQYNLEEIGSGIVQFNNTSFNFGNISEKGGKVFHKFNFVNSGKGPVRIKNVVVSCGCTNTSWTRELVKPGDSGMVIATFDPEGRLGDFDKIITVESDGSPTTQNIVIRGKVYAAKLNFSETYKYQYGKIAVISNTVNFSSIKNNSYDSSEIGLFNMSNKKIMILKIDAPGNITVIPPKEFILPNTDMRIKVIYWPRKPIEYGQTRQEFRLYTNDDTLPVKRFFVNAKVEEDFTWMGKKELKNAPKMVLSTKEFDLGNVPLHASKSAIFTIKNTGKSDLIIRKITRSCNCINPELSQSVIPKGESATLKVLYATVNIPGPDVKTLNIITNDPNNSEITISVKINATE